MSISELIALNAHNRSSEIADGLTGNNALFYVMDKKKKIMVGDFSGSSVYENITYSGLKTVDDGTLWDAGFFKNYASFTPTLGVETVTASEWEASELGAVISISNREKWQNAGVERTSDWAESKISNMKLELQELCSNSAYSDGTAYGGNEFDGLASIISLTPAVGTTGNIDRATAPYWRNQAIDGTVLSATTITAQMDIMDLDTRRGSQGVDCIIAGKNMYRFYQDSLHELRRIHTAGIGDSGFKSLEFVGRPVIYDAALDDNLMYFINTDTLKFRYPKGWWFKVGKVEKVPGTTFEHIPCFVTGNFTCKDLARNGVIRSGV